ncbi:unnamed protein product, partial [Adineta steineri]
RCWEDQLRLKQDDFISECDLYIACLILQKQNEYIDGKKENIVIPSIKMKQIREQNEMRTQEQTAIANQSMKDSTDANMTTLSTNESISSQSAVDSTTKSAKSADQNHIKPNKSIPSTSTEQDQLVNSTSLNPCVLCLTEEIRLACIPCDHLATF